MLRPSFLLPPPGLGVAAPISPATWVSLMLPTPWSRLPARVLHPGGARPGPTEAGAETGSRQSATGARSPPPVRIEI